MAKLGRNEQCWCGSGLKYKKCHLNREAEPNINPWEAEKAFRKSFSTKDCLVASNSKAQCKGGIIRAHSVARSWLRKIAKDSHVYGFKPSIHAIHNNKGRVAPELIGINNASTFTGYCAFHDKSIFAGVEDHPFTGAVDQCFLLAYRAVSREYFTKQSSLSHIQKMRKYDRGKSRPMQIAFQKQLDLHELGTVAGLDDIAMHKGKFDEILTSGDFSDLQYYIIEINETPQVLSSGGVSIAFDFNGNRLQDLSDLSKVPDALYYSVIPTQKGGVIVFCWHKDSAQSCQQFVQSIDTMKPGDVPNSIIRFLFEFCENNYVSPVWWDKLNPIEKDKLIDRFNKAMNPYNKRYDDCLKDDGLSAVQWEVTNTLSSRLF